MSESKPEWLKDLQILRVQPGDLVVVRYEGRLSNEMMERIKDRLSQHLPEGVMVAVLDQGLEIGVIRQDGES